MDNIAISSRVSVFIIKWSFGYLSTGSHSGPQRYIRTQNEPELSGEPCSPIVDHGPGPWASLSVSGAPLAWKTTNKMSTTWQYLGKAVVAYCSLWQVFHSVQSWSPLLLKTTLTIKRNEPKIAIFGYGLLANMQFLPMAQVLRPVCQSVNNHLPRKQAVLA